MSDAEAGGAVSCGNHELIVVRVVREDPSWPCPNLTVNAAVVEDFAPAYIYARWLFREVRRQRDHHGQHGCSDAFDITAGRYDLSVDPALIRSLPPSRGRPSLSTSGSTS